MRRKREEIERVEELKEGMGTGSMKELNKNTQSHPST